MWTLYEDVIVRLPPATRTSIIGILKELNVTTQADWEELTVGQLQTYFLKKFPHSHIISRSLIHARDRCRAALNKLLRLMTHSVDGAKLCRIAVSQVCTGAEFKWAAVYHYTAAVAKWCVRTHAAITDQCKMILNGGTPIGFSAKDVPPFARLFCNSLPLLDHEFDETKGVHQIRNKDALHEWYLRVFCTDALRQSSLSEKCLAIMCAMCPLVSVEWCRLPLPDQTPFDEALQTFFETGQCASSWVFVAFFFGRHMECLEWCIHLCRLCDAHGLSARTRRLYVEAHVTIFHELWKKNKSNFTDLICNTSTHDITGVLAMLQMKNETVADTQPQKYRRRDQIRQATGCRVPSLAVTVEIIHSAIKLTVKAGMWKSMNALTPTVSEVRSFMIQKAVATGASSVRAGVGAGSTFVLDHFSDEEVTKIAGACVTSFDRAVFAILRYTALRRRAICCLRISDMYSLDTGQALSVGIAREKGGHVHEYVVPAQLASCIEDWMTDRKQLQPHVLCGNDPMFPGWRDVRTFCSPDELHRWFTTVANRSGVTGRHVHLHAFRKTLVVMLARLNTLDMVSQWIGHRCMRTTKKYYWNITALELQESMIIPWNQLDEKCTYTVAASAGSHDKAALIDLYKAKIRELESELGAS